MSSTSETYSKSEWFTPDPPDLSPSTHQILLEYSKIPPDEILSHVSVIRDKAWALHPYPCIGTYRFLDLSLGAHPLYTEVLQRLRDTDQVYLDLGCAFGQDIRRLAADGVPGSRLYGSDLRLEFVELGYELFRDKSRLAARFIEADVFALGEGLRELEGKVDIIHAASFFHLFSWDEQVTVAHACTRLLAARPGSLILGRQVGDREPGETAKRLGKGTRYRHNAESWQRLWEQVSKEAGGVKFETTATLRDRSGGPVNSGPSMVFSVRRL